jgi:hypothetical protein
VASGRLHPFSPRKGVPSRLALAFRLTQRFVSAAAPSLAWTKLRVNCREIVQFRVYNPGVQGQRSFMHTFHDPNTVCSLSLAGTLPEGYLFGLLLHEFGHIGSGGGEREADQWILDHFGIRIQYVGALDLEWVDDWAIRRIVRTATPPRLRNPRPGRRLRPRHRPPCLRRPRAVPIDPSL